MVINLDHEQGTRDCSKPATSLAAREGAPQIRIHPGLHTCLILLSICQKLRGSATIFVVFIFLGRKFLNITLHEKALCDPHIVGGDHVDAVQNEGFLDLLERFQIENKY